MNPLIKNHLLIAIGMLDKASKLDGLEDLAKVVDDIQVIISRRGKEELLCEAIDELEGMVDVVDGPSGPRPNSAMRAVQLIEQALGRRPGP